MVDDIAPHFLQGAGDHSNSATLPDPLTTISQLPGDLHSHPFKRAVHTGDDKSKPLV